MTLPIRPSEATLVEVRQALQRIEMNRRTGPKDTLDATSAPGTTDDLTKGYSAGSRILDVTNDNLYICTDATKDKAAWSKVFVGATASDLAGGV